MTNNHSYCVRRANDVRPACATQCQGCSFMEQYPAAQRGPNSEGWIKVEDRRPGQSGHYLGWDAGHGASTVFFSDDRWKDCFGWWDAPITHWMPLPAGPFATNCEGGIHG